ncbi:conserved hypothetical protein [Paecilomyces variotii No. 5]|uniref:Uncharacterized protein n=1 Tax=Byssochlamys spectabilis (strain No. 5 / NBRC 109023) TaxID=1356009 RepID=V5GA93_BYSSN|nr:conserved hypothetical protein [Paecilomyces variotii No. 5]
MARWLVAAVKGYAVVATFSLCLLSGPAVASTHGSIVERTPALSPDVIAPLYVREESGNSNDNGTDNHSYNTVDEGKSVNSKSDSNKKPFPLRVMPLGASITYGYKSSDGNGYREYFLDDLQADGWDVSMVGSVRHGDMKENENEGHPGYRVNQIAQVAKKSLPRKPNLILLNGGTNDGVDHYHVSSTGKRMNSLLDELYKAVPGTTILFSTLIPDKRAPQEIDDINQQYRKLFAERQKAGDRIVLAEMDNGNITTKNLQKDGIHPTDYGYHLMADIWYNTFGEAVEKGMLQAPAATSTSTSTATGSSEAGTATSTDGGAVAATTTSKHSVGNSSRHIELPSILSIIFSALLLIDSFV